MRKEGRRRGIVLEANQATTLTHADEHALAQMTRAEGATRPQAAQEDVAGLAEDLGSVKFRFEDWEKYSQSRVMR